MEESRKGSRSDVWNLRLQSEYRKPTQGVGSAAEDMGVEFSQKFKQPQGQFRTKNKPNVKE